MKAGVAGDLRFLILAPTTRDAQITADLLRGAGIDTESFTTLDALVGATGEGAAGILIPEEFLSGALKAPLAAALAKQPP